jgi:RimJ/RimL family protein N-acetyltransferase
MVTLVPVSRSSLDAESVGDFAGLALGLGVVVDEWPPTGGEWDVDAANAFRAMIDDAGYESRFGAFYVVDDGRLVGSAGFFGSPDERGEVEIGYSICENERRKGFATAAIDALCRSAASSGCRAVRARVRGDNTASISALRSNSFIQSGSDAADGLLVFRVMLDPGPF